MSEPGGGGGGGGGGGAPPAVVNDQTWLVAVLFAIVFETIFQ